MRVDDALRQIEAIHEQLDKGEVYRGLQVGGVVVAGFVGLAAAVVQNRCVAHDQAVLYWVGVALVCGVISGGSALWSLLFREDAWARRKTLRLVCQFVPSIFGGVIVTYVFKNADLTGYLPGLWALIFGLGVLGARPYLPRAIGWVALFYLIAGGMLLLRAGPTAEILGWQVGGVFGLGLLGSALVLSRNRERDNG